MKTCIYAILLYSILLNVPQNIYCQDECDESFKAAYLNANNIRAAFYPKGNKFTDGSRGSFLAPFNPSNKVSTVFASSPWIGGFDDAQNLKLAVETYPSKTKSDFHVGPLTSIGLPYDTGYCKMFDKVWSVYADDIYRHRLDWETDFKIDDTISSIFGWPARGNPYFSQFNGFDLPDPGIVGYASYVDYNQNRQYEPEKGDYPAILWGTWPYIPDQILWMVFNGVDTNYTSGDYPLRFEIQLTAFAFHCQENDILNNTIFNSYKIINRAITSVDSVFFGFWTDYDLGCSADDFIGSDSARSTEFVYNADSQDGDTGVDCSSGVNTYADRVPIQSMTYLSHPMHSFISAEGADEPIEYYRLLNGQWADGTDITPQSNGYDPLSTLSATKFLFNGDPREPTSWSANNVFSEGDEQRAVSSISLERGDPGKRWEILTAHMFHYEPASDHLGQITAMYSNVDSLREIIGNLHPHLEFPCTPFPFCTHDDCVWPGDFDKNGIADHRDYLMWGLMKESSGNARNGIISWRAHPGEDWNTTIDGINTKHGDGDGNGIVNIKDIDVNTEHFLLTNDTYDDTPAYPQGDEIVLTFLPNMDLQGRVKNLKVSAGVDLQNIIGLAFELEFDTSLYTLSPLFPDWPDEVSSIQFAQYRPDQHLKAAFVQTNNTGIYIDQNFVFLRGLNTALTLKPGSPIPDSTVIRLRNLIGRDADGQDMQLGSNRLVVYKEGITGLSDFENDNISIYPNPTHGDLYVEGIEEVEGEISNLHGQVIEKIILRSNKIDLSAYPAGLYLLRLPTVGKTYKVVVY